MISGSLGESEDHLREFYETSCNLISRVDSMRWSEENKPGHEEWCEFRADILVSWQMYWDGIWKDGRDPKIYFHHPREHYRPDISEAVELLREVVGDIPRKGRERWLAGVEDRSRWGTRDVTTKAEFKNRLGDLLRADSKHPKEYRDIYNRLLEEYISTGKIK